MTEREVIDLVIKLTNENKKLLKDYKDAIVQLDKAVEIVKKSEKKWWVVHQKLITFVGTVLALLVLIVGVLVAMKATNTCLVNVNSQSNATFSSCTAKT